MPLEAKTVNHLDDDRLMDLVHELLDVRDAEACFAHLRVCAACESRFRAQLGLRERLRATPPPRSASQSTRSRRWAFAAAAAAALAMAVLAPLALRERSHTVADYWLPLDRGEVAVRDASPSDPTADLRAAFEAYAERDSARALDLLERAKVPESHRQLREVFRASALLLEDRPREARETLLALPLTAMPEPWRNRANWLLYIALTRTGEDARAGALLDGLSTLPGEIGDLARAESAAQPAGPKSTKPAQ
jgi:hypothetical protein